MTMKKQHKFSVEQIVTLEIDTQGRISLRLTDLDRDNLENTLLSALYPGIKVAVVNVPEDSLDAYEESLVTNAMANLKYRGIEYKLIGASASAKEGKFYFVDKEHAAPIIERFQHWPQAAIVYFGILVSDCKVVIEEPDVRVLVVQDHELGTNDCRGWIRRSLFDKLELPENRFYQFRLAFERTQAKGAFKVAEDDVCDLLEADIILPESAVKPGLKIPVMFYSVFGNGRRFRGPVVLGIREVSRELEFESSYTLIEHAPDESIQLEILPEALGQVRRLNDAVAKGDYEELLEILGVHVNEEKHDDESELRIVEASLLADKTGYIVRFPYINNQLNKMLAHWAYKAATGGGFRLPAYALADDGYLVACDGKIFAGSDWIPRDQAVTSLTSKRGLCARYPIRMFEDLLPMQHIGAAELVMRLMLNLHDRGCDAAADVAQQIATNQLWLEGTYVLHSETAKKNGGDYDFDWVCVLEEERFPRFVAGRFGLEQEFQQTKTKHKKAKSAWWNVEQVAMKARGNQVGIITDLKTSCLAAGRPDLAYRLVTELQNALDSLKHEVAPDQKVIAQIRDEVDTASWLRFKNAQRISDLPIHLDVASTDRIGKLYNYVRKEIEDLLADKLEIGEFKGLFTGEEVSREMFEECRRINGAYAAIAGGIAERQQKVKADLEKAQSEWDKAREGSDKELRKKKYLARKKAYAANRASEERAKGEMKAILNWIRVWAGGKTEKRAAWCQALHTVVCNGRGNGSILFHAFPQEIIDKLAERMGGRAVRVSLPDLGRFSSTIDPEGRVFLIETFIDKEKHLYLFQYKDGKVLLPSTTTAQP